MRWLFVCATLIGCGSDDGGEAEASSSGTPHPQYFATLEDLPGCTAENVHWLVYVANEKQLRSCTEAGMWEPVQLGEPADEPAPQGVSAVYACDGSEVDISVDPNLLTKGMGAYVTAFATGDWAITCFDYEANVSSTYADSSTNQQFYKAGGVWQTAHEGVISCVTMNTLSTFNTAAPTSLTWQAVSGGDALPVNCAAQ